MTRSALLKLISQGEDSVLQFKLDVTSTDSLAAEFVAMSNGKQDWPDITFLDDREGGLFTATVRRALPTKPGDGGTTERTTQKTTQKILGIVANQPTLNRKEIAELLGNITQDGVKYHLEKLKAVGKLRRIGPDKGGHWEVVNL